jgi:polar amino acid transport system substrate-binding protein/cystine transport system substrate-binding protein/membrane-bound lytic murein transglycosylase F
MIQRRDLLAIAAGLALLDAVEKSGVLRACLPPSYPPLVNGEAGLDVELLRGAAGELGVGFVAVGVPEMGRSFDPHGWRVTRAQCDLLAGGVLDTPVTRSFLDVTAAHAVTGWAWIGKGPSFRRVGVLVSATGLDRVGLAAWLQGAGATVEVLPDGEAAIAGLRGGRLDVVITERLLAVDMARREGLLVGWVGPERVSVVFGLWKGDVTLKRAVSAAFARLEQRGEVARLRERYLGTDVTSP